MKAFLTALVIFLCAAAAIAASEDEQKFLSKMGFEDYEVTYRDVGGADITFDEFQAGMKTNGSYSMVKDPDGRKLIIQVKQKSNRVPVADKILVKRGELMPEASLRDLAGRTVGLHARGGRPLLINFFFAACAPCITETPALNAFAKQRKDIDVAAVTFDDPASARKFVAKWGFEWPVVPEGQGFMDKVGIKSFPSFAYLGVDGKVLGIASSSEIGKKPDLTAEELDAWITRLAAK